MTLCLAGCARPAVEANLGPFIVLLEPDHGRMAVRRRDGTVLLDGLAGGDARTPRGVAFRDTPTSVEQQYGSYRFAPDTGPFRVATGFSAVRADGAQVAFTLDGIDGGAGVVRLLDAGALAIDLGAGAADRASLALRAVDGEHLLGLGAHTQDLDHRGQTVASWVSEQGIGQTDSAEPSGAWFLQGTRHQTYFPVPFLLSSRGYGLEVVSERRALFELGSVRPDELRVEVWDRTLALVLYDGPTVPEVLARRTDHVGRPPVPPAWAFGVWNDAIFDSGNVRRLAALLRASAIPSSAIWAEDWAGGEEVGDSYGLPYEWRVDRTRYPDLEALAAELHADGYKLLGYFNTFVESDVSHFAETRDRGLLVAREDGSPYLFQSARFQPAALLDLTNPDARRYLAARMDAALDLGFDGWMADYAEWLPTDARLFSGERGLDAHNRYPVDWQALNAEVLGARADAPELLSFVRSGYTASARVPHQIVWGGDQLVSFRADDGLPTVIPLALGLGLSGLPYFGSDIGGYTNVDTLPVRSKELFFRWTSLAAFSTVMRTHHGGWPRRNWDLERDAETLQHFARWARVHTRLYPYLQALAERAARTGLPLMRPLFLESPADEAAYAQKDELLLGPALLVAPVQVEGAQTREVLLPAGRWLPLGFADDGTPTRAGAPLAGGRRVQASAATTELPVYLRAGTVVPLLPPGVATLAKIAEGRPGVDRTRAGDARVLVVGLGDVPHLEGASVRDDRGARYALSLAGAPTATPTLRRDGQPLTIAASTTETTVQLVGGGVVELLDAGVPIARLEISDRPANAPLEIHFIY